ncbi:MAG: hypothetical protein A2749_01635 [Parcubacteria group bacterium RIFCSPHIGHO2_01_FULL_45_26]|nr:MAG: hypothetical protein A2749_01635 [Parcubacteria group bacterium RIFCSPHIGHO2_01_FULL_45_26]
MAEKPEKRRQRRRKEWKYDNFAAVLALPERLAHFLRLWLHLDKSTWDFCLDKLRQHRAWDEQVAQFRAQEGKKRKKGEAEVPKPPRCGPAYLEWSKSKGRGKGRRYFAAPCEELKVVQKAINNRILAHITVHFARHGGQIGSSILTNAGHHAGFAKTVFSLDIVNAFPSVYRSRVKAVLGKPIRFGLQQFAGVAFSPEDEEAICASIADLLVFKERLPQGPPTSPRVFDICCGKLDQEIFALLQGHSTPFQSYRYTAWTDNLTFSSDGEIPEPVREQLVELVRKNGFFPHTRPDKMRYYSRETGEVPIVTGLVLGAEGMLTMAPRKVNQLRARLHRFERLANWDDQIQGEVAGTLGYIRQVYPKRLPSKLRDVVAAIDSRLAANKAVTTEVATAPTPAPSTRPKTSKAPGKSKGKARAKSAGKPKVKEELLAEAVS